MLFEDDISYIDDFDGVRKSPKCKAVPLKTKIILKDIWIPSEWLINRAKAMDSNRKGPGKFHTLYKPDVESFSVYIDNDFKGSTENDNLQTFKLSNSYEKNLYNVSNPTNETDSPKLCFSDKDENSEHYSPKLYFSDENENVEEDSPKQCFLDKVKNSEKELQLFLTLLNKEPTSHESKTECQDNEKSINLKDTTGHMEKQNKIENKQCEQVLGILNSELPITTEDETECHIKEKSEIFLHTLNSKCSLCKDKTLDSVCHSKGKFENFLDAVIAEKQNLEENAKKQNLCLDTLSSEAKIECHDKENSDNLIDMVSVEKMCDDSSTGSVSQAVAKLPIPYQKHSFQDPPTKQKNQKQKKKKNAVNKSIQLGEFLEITNSDGYEIPESHAFYDSLVHRGLCAPRDLPSSTGFPEAEYDGSSTQVSSRKDFPEDNSSLLSNNDCVMSLFDRPYSTNFPEENSSVPSNNDCAMPSFESIENENVQPSEVEELEDKTITTLVLENIGCDNSIECVEHLMSTYGDLKNISFKTDENGKSFKAYVKLVLDYDVEWIIDCLNGTEPFGASCGLLKCYQLQE